MPRLLAALFILLTPALIRAQEIDPQRLGGYADGMMRQAMEQNKVAGATIAVVQDGRILLAKGYGTARIQPRPVATSADTLFQIASISKTPVYLAIMQLAETGKVKLDDPVNNHLPPSLKIPDQGHAKPVTIRHLLTHSAGFEDLALGHLFVNAPERLMSLQAYLARYRPDRVNSPGVQISYSNYSVALLGAIIAHTSGLDFPTYMERRILRPLGMMRASYREPYSPAIMKRFGLPAALEPQVRPYLTQQLGGEPGRWTVLGPEWTTMITPAGGMRASANDMAQYMLALSDPERLEAAGVLKSTSFAKMLEPGINLPGAVRHGFINYSFQGGRTGFGHDGAMGYGASDMIIVPDLKLGVFVSTNGRGGFTFAYDLVRRMLKDFAPLPEQQPVRNAETKAMANSLAGNWMLNRRAWSRTELSMTFFNAALSVDAQPNGDLLIGDLVSPPQRFVPMGGGVWQSPTRYSRRIVASDAQGRLTIWSGSGANAALRASLWQDARLIVGIIALTLIFASTAAARGALRLRKGGAASPSERFAERTAVAAALAWAIGFGGYATTLLLAIPSEGVELLFTWPGGMAPIAWIIALAVLLTVIALPGLAIWMRPGHWTFWRKLRHSLLLALFVLAGLASWTLGLVGYSGF